MYDFPTNPPFGTVVNVPDGSYRVWDRQKWTAAPSANVVLPGVGYLPLAGGIMAGSVQLTGMSSAVNFSTANPSPIPGYVFSSRYGTQTAFDIYSKLLNTNPAEANRNTFNVLEGVLTLPPTVTTNSTYHAAISGFVSNQSTHGVGFGVGGYAVAEANNTVTGAFGSVNVDSPRDLALHKPNGMYTGVRLQIEHDWYTGNATSSVRGTLHDGFFSVPPNSLSNLFGYATNIFTPQFAVCTGYITTHAPTDTQSVMTIVSITSSGASIGVVATPIVGGLHLEGTGVDSSANITIVPFTPTPPTDPFTGLPCTGTGNLGTYLISANVGTVGSAGSPVTIRATNSYQWNASFVSPDGVAITAMDVGQRNFAVSNSFGDRSQYVNWRYTNVAPDTISGLANERVLQQWVEPIAGVASPQAAPPDTGGVLYIRNYLQALAPASYGIQNWNWNNAAFVSKNNANTGWIDALHVEGNDRVVLGAGSKGITEIATSQGIQVEVIDNGTAVVNAVGMSGATASTPGYIHMVGGGTLALQHTGGPTTVGGPFSYTATGGTTSRSAQARAADVANVLDYGAGIGGDDAAAIRAAIASNKKLIFIPPGTYTMKSVVPTFGSAIGPNAFEIRGRTDTWIIAYGATFLIDNSVSAPAAGAPCTLAFTGNSKNCGILGGTFVGNYTGLTTGQENIGIDFDCVTGLTVRDVKFTGTFLVSIAGVYAFDSVFEDCEGFNNANAIDCSHLENVTFKGCRFQADTTQRYTGLSLHYDMPTLGDNIVTNEDGSARTLQGGADNNVRVLDCMFVGYQNGIAINEINGCLISRTIIKGGLGSSTGSALGGVILYCNPDAIAAGLRTTNVTIEDCDIYGNGNTGGLGGGINFAAGAGGMVSNVNVLNNRIYDNTNCGIGSVDNHISGIVISGNDFRTRSTGTSPQTQAILSGLAAVLAGGAGVVRNNVSVTPIGSELPVYPNLTSVSWQDASGVTQPIMGVNAANATYMRPASNVANIQFQNYGGGPMLTVNSAANIVEALAPIVQPNGNPLYWRDSANALQPIMALSNANTMYIRPGAAAGNIWLQSYAGVTLLEVNSTTLATTVYGDLRVNGKAGFFNTAPVAKPTAGGAWAGNTAGKALSTALAALGLITDTSTA